MPVYVSALFCGLNPRTVLHLSLSKFQSSPRLPARFGARVKRVLFLSFFGCPDGARAEQTRPATEVADILRHKTLRAVAGPSWTPVSVPAFFLYFFIFLGVAVNATYRSNKLHCHLIQGRRLHNVLSYGICCVKNYERKLIVGSRYRRS